MCDTLLASGAATAGGVTLFAKNSDREPGEAQVVERVARRAGAGRIRVTHAELPDVAQTFEVILSRPFWMWGAEMGVNEKGVAIGNEAVFTRLPLTGALTGMDLLRLGLERAATAREAVEVMVGLLTLHGQGGRMGYRARQDAYASSFLVADPAESWVLETAGSFWAAQKVTGARSISNGLTIGTQMDLVDDRAFAFARQKGWCKSAADFDFARCFSARAITALAGARRRRAQTTQALEGAPATLETMKAALRDHAGRAPGQGLVMSMTCSHASWLPTRSSAQTTGSLVARLPAAAPPEVWLTGTSSPCLSVFKQVPWGQPIELPEPGPRFDDATLWWRHERVHRALMRSRWRGAEAVEEAARALEARGAGWAEHHAALGELWAGFAPGRPSLRPSRWYWQAQSRRDGVAG
jgi:secernin